MERGRLEPTTTKISKKQEADTSASQKTPALTLAQHILHLQRTVGNRTVGRLIQAKLAVSHPGDSYEREADRVAEQVTSMPSPASMPTVQRQMIPEEEKDTQPLQTKPLAASITPLAPRQAMPEEEKGEPPVQQKPLAASITPFAQRQMIPEEDKKEKPPVQRSAGEERVEAGHGIEQQLGQSSGKGSHLPESVRSYMEPRFGADFSGVRVHTGSEAQHLNRSLNAQAFTVGQDIYYGASKSPTDVSLTAHELTHVVQQRGGGTTQRKLARGESDIFLRQGEDNRSSRAGQELLAHELTQVVQQDGEQLQRARTQAKEGAATGGAPSGREKGPLNFLSTAALAERVARQGLRAVKADAARSAEGGPAGQRALELEPEHSDPPSRMSAFDHRAAISFSSAGAGARPAEAEADRIASGESGIQSGQIPATPPAGLRPLGFGTPLPEGVRAQAEAVLATDFSDVRVHSDAAADRAARLEGSTAFTQGSSIAFRSDAWAPGTPSGQQLILHELAHVTQQRDHGVVALQRYQSRDWQAVADTLTLDELRAEIDRLNLLLQDAIESNDQTLGWMDQLSAYERALAAAGGRPTPGSGDHCGEPGGDPGGCGGERKYGRGGSGHRVHARSDRPRVVQCRLLRRLPSPAPAGGDGRVHPRVAGAVPLVLRRLPAGLAGRAGPGTGQPDRRCRQPDPAGDGVVAGVLDRGGHDRGLRTGDQQ